MTTLWQKLLQAVSLTALSVLCPYVVAASNADLAIATYSGRVVVDGRDTCNFTMLAPSIALTAAHCLHDETGKIVDVNNVRVIVQGPDSIRRLFQIVDIALDPDYLYAQTVSTPHSRLPSDIALLKTDGIAAKGATLTLSPADLDPEVVFIPQGLSGERMPHKAEACPVEKVSDNLMLLGCQRGHGFSGSGVLAAVGGKYRVVSVVTALARRGEATQLYATKPQYPISKSIWISQRLINKSN